MGLPNSSEPKMAGHPKHLAMCGLDGFKNARDLRPSAVARAACESYDHHAEVDDVDGRTTCRAPRPFVAQVRQGGRYVARSQQRLLAGLPNLAPVQRHFSASPSDHASHRWGTRPTKKRIRRLRRRRTRIWTPVT
jgi:hypothetical protein